MAEVRIALVAVARCSASIVADAEVDADGGYPPSTVTDHAVYAVRPPLRSRLTTRPPAPSLVVKVDADICSSGRASVACRNTAYVRWCGTTSHVGSRPVGAA